MEQCAQPAIITKDISLIIYGRDARIYPRISPNAKALKHLLSGAYRNADFNHQSAVYELLLKRAVDTGSPGVQRRQRRVLDTSSTYVRGEENLHGWQPRGDSLIFDHQWELEKMHRIEIVERIRHVLMVREKLNSDQPNEEVFVGMTTSSSRMNLAALTSPSSPTEVHADDSMYQPWDMTEQERELCLRCVQLIQTHLPSKPGPHAIKKHSLQPPIVEEIDLPSSVNSSPEVLSPEKPLLPTSWGQTRSSLTASPGDLKNATELSLCDLAVKPVYVPELEEIRVSPIVSKKGSLYLLDEKTSKWVQRWLVVKRPYLFMYVDESDPVERGLINLGSAKIEYSEQTLPTRQMFSVTTKVRAYVFQTTCEKDVHDWLYAINPLLAGEIRSKLSRGGRILEPLSTQTDNDANQCNI